MTKPKRNSCDLKLLFHELDLALDKADFTLSEKLIDELIDVAKEIYPDDEESQKRIIKIIQ